MPLYWSAFAGSWAGAAYWGVPYPADTLKSKIQTDERFRGHSFSQARPALASPTDARPAVAHAVPTAAHASPPASPPRPAHPHTRGAQVFRAVLREEGVAGLYKGCAITCARAVPSHAAIFYLYEVASQQLAKY